MKHKPTNSDDPASLITKREYFAAFALSGMVAAKYPGNNIPDDVEASIKLADELIAQLNGATL